MISAVDINKFREHQHQTKSSSDLGGSRQKQDRSTSYLILKYGPIKIRAMPEPQKWPNIALILLEARPCRPFPYVLLLRCPCSPTGTPPPWVSKFSSGWCQECFWWSLAEERCDSAPSQFSGKASSRPSLWLVTKTSLLCPLPLWWMTAIFFCLPVNKVPLHTSDAWHVAECPSDWAWPPRALNWGRGHSIHRCMKEYLSPHLQNDKKPSDSDLSQSCSWVNEISCR